MGIGAAILGSSVLGLAGSAISANAANKASKRQAAAARRAQAQYAPFTKVGQGAVTTLGRLYGIGAEGQQIEPDFSQFRRTPDYQFAFDEGRRALEFSNAAKGQLLSGNNLRDLTRFGQGLATQNFGNFANRLMQLSQLGRGAASGSAEAIGNQGQAQASGIIGQANAWNQGLQGLGNNLAMYSMLQGSPSAYGSGNPMSGWSTSIVPTATL